MLLEDYIQQVADQINEEDGIKAPHEAKPTKKGKYYDWEKDFTFTPDVVSDLRKRDLFGISEGGGIYVMIPVNRKDAPDYYSKDHFNYMKDKDGNWKNDKELDFEPYNILHIYINVSAKEKKLNIRRYYGHRLDWNGENHTSTEQDWSDIPVLTKKTVQSLIDVYNTHEVFDKLLDNIILNADKHEEYLDKYVGTEEKVRKRVEQNPKYYNLQKELDKLVKARKDKFTWYSAFADNCQAITDGDYKSFEWKWDYPEIPDPEYIKQRHEEHSRQAQAINKSLDDYYATNRYTGD